MKVKSGARHKKYFPEIGTPNYDIPPKRVNLWRFQCRHSRCLAAVSSDWIVIAGYPLRRASWCPSVQESGGEVFCPSTNGEGLLRQKVERMTKNISSKLASQNMPSFLNRRDSSASIVVES
jgi:hypothetical protein